MTYAERVKARNNKTTKPSEIVTSKAPTISSYADRVKARLGDSKVVVKEPVKIPVRTNRADLIEEPKAIGPSKTGQIKDLRTQAQGYSLANRDNAVPYKPNQLKRGVSVEGLKAFGEFGADIGKGAVGSFVTGTEKMLSNLAELPSVFMEAPLEMARQMSNTTNKEAGITMLQENREARNQAVTETQKATRQWFGVKEPEEMSKVGRFMYNLFESAPASLSGAGTLVLSAMSANAQDAKADGANPLEAVIYGVATAVPEGLLENMFGIASGIKGVSAYVKKIASGGFGFVAKTTAKEATEEVAQEALNAGMEWLIYNKNKDFSELPKQLGEAGLSGAIMALIFTAFGLPLNSLARKKAQKAVDSGKQITIEEANKIKEAIESEQEKVADKANIPFKTTPETASAIGTMEDSIAAQRFATIEDTAPVEVREETA